VNTGATSDEIDGQVANASAEAAASQSSLPSRRSRNWLLIVCSMGVLLVISSMVALNAALGAIAVETLATQSQLTWIVDGYTPVMACLLLPALALGNRFGRRTILLVGLVIFATASLAPIYFGSRRISST
jgi:MFS family permease